MKQFYTAVLSRFRPPIQNRTSERMSTTDLSSTRLDWLKSLPFIHDMQYLRQHDLAWWTYGAQEYIDAFLAGRVEAEAFEWGSGASTFWLARRAQRVRSVEHDAIWAQEVVPLLPDNATVQLMQPTKLEGGEASYGSNRRAYRNFDFRRYVEAIDASQQKYDVIAIDGRAREACFAMALPHLKHDGIIVMDNVERRRYRRMLHRYSGSIRKRVFWGLTPTLPYPSGTAVITRR